MSHIIGKVYEVNQVNMNKLIAELEKLQKQIDSLNLTNEALCTKLETVMKQNEILIEALKYYNNHGSVITEIRMTHNTQDFETVSSFINHVAREALAKIEALK